MAINQQASRDATSKAPVLVCFVNQGGWPASSPITPPQPSRLAAAALMPQPPPPPLTAERGESHHRLSLSGIKGGVSRKYRPHFTKEYGPLSHCARFVFISRAID